MPNYYISTPNFKLLIMNTKSKSTLKKLKQTNDRKRTNDGFAFAKNRSPETDHDIAEVCSIGDNKDC